MYWYSIKFPVPCYYLYKVILYVQLLTLKNNNNNIDINISGDNGGSYISTCATSYDPSNSCNPYIIIKTIISSILTLSFY